MCENLWSFYAKKICFLGSRLSPYVRHLQRALKSNLLGDVRDVGAVLLCGAGIYLRVDQRWGRNKENHPKHKDFLFIAAEQWNSHHFLSSLRGQTAKTLICTKSGVSADSRKSAEKCRKVRRTALFAQKVYKKCAKSAVLRTFRHFSALFLESAETPLFVQINVFAVWPLRLDRKYTIPMELDSKEETRRKETHDEAKN